MPERDPTRLLRRPTTALCLSLVILLMLASCTRAEVASVVSTVVFDLQATLEPANLTSVAIRESGATREPLPTTAALSVITVPTQPATAVPTSTVEPPAPTPSELPPTELPPTPVPTATPVATPTDAPTAEPTTEPTAEPTAEPTEVPTEEPTTEPTIPPTPIPSPSPASIPEEITQGNTNMRLAPDGLFRRGANSGELLEECSAFRPGCQAAWFSASEPAYTVVVSPFYIDEHEVTNLSFVTFLNNAEDSTTLCGGQPCLDLEQSAITETAETGFQIEADLADHPVTGVTWFGAAAYCEARGARLPTESEWEKAALWDPVSELKTRYPWGDVFDGTLVNFCDAACEEEQRNEEFDDGFAGTAPVASYEAGRSPIGAYDMAGNVWEWVSDWYDADAYSAVDRDNPTGPAEGTEKVVRGGSWFDTGNFTSGLIRFPSPPENADATIGFRCAASVP